MPKVILTKILSQKSRSSKTILILSVLYYIDSKFCGIKDGAIFNKNFTIKFIVPKQSKDQGRILTNLPFCLKMIAWIIFRIVIFFTLLDFFSFHSLSSIGNLSTCSNGIEKIMFPYLICLYNCKCNNRVGAMHSSLRGRQILFICILV